MNGHAADQVIVTALVGSGDSARLGMFVVPTDQQSVTRQAFTAVDGSRGAAFQFESVSLPAGSLLGVGEPAVGLIARALDRAIVALGAESLGAMQVLLEATVDYAKTREQFCQPIG